MTEKGEKKRPGADETTQTEETQTDQDPGDAGADATADAEQAEQQGDDPIDEMPEEAAPAGDIQEKLASTLEELKEAQDRVLRVSAEFENYKKRSAREMASHRKYANETLIKSLLPVVDNLELAIRSAKENGKGDNGLLEGVEMTRKEILKVFEKFGVTPIEAEGQPFDPSVHEAAMQESSDAVPENTVIREFQKGYMIQERLLRPSMVVVSKGEDGAATSESE